MSSKANVTTPGGFFVGLGGIVSFCVVAAAVSFWVKSHATSEELRPQQVALGLRAANDAPGAEVQKKEDETNSLLKDAGQRYNGGAQPNIDKIDDLRGVIRFREAKKTIAEADKALTGATAWKDKAKGEVTMPISLAMNVVANGLKDRKPKPSAVKVDPMPALDPNAAPLMPNAMGGGAKTVFFADPHAAAAPAAAAPAPAQPAAAPAALAPSTPKPAPAPAPAAPAPAAPAQPSTAPTAPPAAVPPTVPAPAPANPAPPTPPAPAAPAAPNASLSAPQTPVAIAAPARPTLLNWPESKK